MCGAEILWASWTINDPTTIPPINDTQTNLPCTKGGTSFWSNFNPPGPAARTSTEIKPCTIIPQTNVHYDVPFADYIGVPPDATIGAPYNETVTLKRSGITRGTMTLRS